MKLIMKKSKPKLNIVAYRELKDYADAGRYKLMSIDISLARKIYEVELRVVAHHAREARFKEEVNAFVFATQTGIEDNMRFYPGANGANPKDCAWIPLEWIAKSLRKPSRPGVDEVLEDARQSREAEAFATYVFARQTKIDNPGRFLQMYESLKRIGSPQCYLASLLEAHS